MTVRDLLVHSLSQRPIADGLLNDIYAIESPDGVDFSNYLIRARNGVASEFTEALNSTTALTNPYWALNVPDFLFVGPNVSQSLLQVYSDDFVSPALEIVPKQKGIMLAEYILGPDASFDTETRRARRLELMQELSKPESDALKNLFMQVAFIAQQPPSHPYFDINDGTIMVERDEDGVHLRLVDIIGQETLDIDGSRNEQHYPIPPYTPPMPQKGWKDRILRKPSAPPEVDPAELARHESEGQKNRQTAKLVTYLMLKDNGLYRGMVTFLNNYLNADFMPEDYDSEICVNFNKKLNEAFRAVVDAVEKGEMPDEWKGFQRIIKPESESKGLPNHPQMEAAELYREGEELLARRISAVQLSDTPQALRHALDRISSIAITPER